MLLFVVFVLSLALTKPTPPAFPEQFSATCDGVDYHGKSYTCSMYFDFVNQFVRQDSKTGSEVYSYIDRYDVLKDYNYCAWIPQCVVWILVPPMRRWEVPSDSEYIGKETIRGMSCDHWKYSWSHGSLKETDDFYVYYNSTGKFYQPVRNVYWWSTTGTTKVDWMTFNPTQPLQSLFNVPSSWGCASEKNVEKSVGRRSKPGLFVVDEGCPPSN